MSTQKSDRSGRPSWVPCFHHIHAAIRTHFGRDRGAALDVYMTLRGQAFHGKGIHRPTEVKTSVRRLAKDTGYSKGLTHRVLGELDSLGVIQLTHSASKSGLSRVAFCDTAAQPYQQAEQPRAVDDDTCVPEIQTPVSRLTTQPTSAKSADTPLPVGDTPVGPKAGKNLQEFFQQLSQERLSDECETSRAEAEQMPPAAQGSQTLENPVRTPSGQGESIETEDLRAAMRSTHGVWGPLPPAVGDTLDSEKMPPAAQGSQTLENPARTPSGQGESIESGSASDSPVEAGSSPEQCDSQTGFQRDRVPLAVGDTLPLTPRQRQHLAEAVASCHDGEDRLALIQADIAARAETDRPIANPVGYTIAALRDPEAYPLDAGKRWREKQAERRRVEAMKQRARVEREERLREEAASKRAEDQSVQDLERFKKRNPEEYAALWETVCEEVATLPSVVTLRLTPGRPMFDRMVRDRVVARLRESLPITTEDLRPITPLVS